MRDTVSRALDLVHFKYGEVLLTAGEGERAAKEFLAATKVERAEPALVTMAHLYAARAFDLAGKRDDALAQYREGSDAAGHLRCARRSEEGPAPTVQDGNREQRTVDRQDTRAARSE